MRLWLLTGEGAGKIRQPYVVWGFEVGVDPTGDLDFVALDVAPS